MYTTTANISYSGLNIRAGDTVTFSGYTDIPNVSGWMWDFGDGSPMESGKITTHEFSSSGEYTATVTASGNVPYSGSASGIYLNTYIIDDFGNEAGVSGFDPAWDSEFTSSKIVDCGGYLASKLSDTDTILAPSGGTATITGRFDFQFDAACACTTDGNRSIHFELYRSNDTQITEMGYDIHGFNFDGDDLGVTGDEHVDGRRYTIRMTRGYSLDADGDHTEESVEVIRGYYLDNWSGGASYDWREFPNSPKSGTAFDDDFYINLNHGESVGYDNLILQADGGLPYSGPEEQSTSGFLGSGSITFTVIPSGYDFYHTGTVQGKGLIQGIRQIIYAETPLPPSGAPISTYTPILMNKRRYVYKLDNDYIQTKLMVLQGKALSYLNNLAVELWFNYDGTWKKYEDYTTNRYGIAHMKRTTEFIPNINCCLGIARVIINGTTYNSNLVRFNFVEGIPLTYEIDAGSCTETILDRSSYDIFDASGTRSLVIDRMWEN